MGHVQLIQLPPCPPQPLSVTTSPTHRPSPAVPAPNKPHKQAGSIIVAHTTALSTLTLAPSGNLLATTSNRGTLIRVWDTYSGKLMRELRRGTDQAEIYGVAYRPDERELCVWSDKGTIHVFALSDGKGSAYVIINENGHLTRFLYTAAIVLRPSRPFLHFLNYPSILNRNGHTVITVSHCRGHIPIRPTSPPWIQMRETRRNALLVGLTHLMRRAANPTSL